MRFGKNAEFGGSLFLPPDVNLRGRIFADAHERKPGLDAARFQGADPRSKFALDLRRNGPPVNKVVEKHQPGDPKRATYSTTWIRWMVITGVFHRASRLSSPVTTMRRFL